MLTINNKHFYFISKVSLQVEMYYKNGFENLLFCWSQYCTELPESFDLCESTCGHYAYGFYTQDHSGFQSFYDKLSPSIFSVVPPIARESKEGHYYHRMLIGQGREENSKI